jgi:mannose/cellobiose epimerase-like protein (N-acyl-D-glucosamine 2-epimerase family)
LALACHSLFFLPYGLWRIEMNDDDLRDCFAMFALAGAVMASKDRTAQEIWQIADEMMEARKKESINEEDSGIAAVVPKRPRKR